LQKPQTEPRNPDRAADIATVLGLAVLQWTANPHSGTAGLQGLVQEGHQDLPCTPGLKAL
jgi:hypothetical protein